jgi:hypothetical protein
MRISSIAVVVITAAGLSPADVTAGDTKIDLSTKSGSARVHAEWRYLDAKLVEIDVKQPDGKPGKTHDIEPRGETAGQVGYDDSAWTVIAPETLPRRRANGRVCFAWYRVKITIPPEAAGKSVFFRTTIDDYGEVWVDGKMPYAVGKSGEHIVAGFNVPNRVELKNAAPGKVYQLAIFGINGPLSASPTNGIFLKNTFLDIVDQK